MAKAPSTDIKDTEEPDGSGFSEVAKYVSAGVFGAGATALGVAATIVASSTSYLNKDRELDIRMVEISLSILKGEIAKDDRTGIYARRFALEALSKYSGVPIDAEDQKRWAEEGTVPFDEIRTSGGPGVHLNGWALESNGRGFGTYSGSRGGKPLPLDHTEQGVGAGSPPASPIGTGQR